MPRKKNDKRIKPIRMYLVKARYNLGYSQLMVSKLIGIDHCTFNQIENGKLGSLMNAKKLITLAEALHIDLEQLVHMEAEYLDEAKRLNSIE